MPESSWFDPQKNALSFAEYQQKMASWQEALEDGKVTAAELTRQMERVAGLLQALEPKLSAPLHAELTLIFNEVAVLYGLQHIFEMQTMFSDEQ